MDTPLSPTNITQALTTRWLGHACYYFPQIDSTNLWLRQEASLRDDMPHGALAITDFQTRGRGRLERRWEAPANSNLLFSLFFRPNWSPARANWLTMLAGLAAVEGIAHVTGLQVCLKWPNDVVVPTPDGGWRKLGGILLEGVWRDGRLAQAVLGIGLNVNAPRADLPAFAIPATSILVETGQPGDRLRLLAQLLARLEARYEAADAGQSPQPAWEARLILRRQEVRIQDGGETVLRGIFAGTDDWGNLLLRDNAGKLHTISAGDVSLHRP